jgi:hypothetical protein
MENTGGILLTPEQIATAPPDVQRWIQGSALGLDMSGDGFVLRQNGTASSDDGLAVCSTQEIKMLLRRLSENYAALQVFFQLGCDYRNPATGERRPYPLRLADFRRNTDVGNIPRLRSIIHDINESLAELRGDSDAVLCRISGHDVYDVNEMTQFRIYRFWLQLSKAGAKHARVMPFPPRGELVFEEHLDDGRVAI